MPRPTLIPSLDSMFPVLLPVRLSRSAAPGIDIALGLEVWPIQWSCSQVNSGPMLGILGAECGRVALNVVFFEMQNRTGCAQHPKNLGNRRKRVGKHEVASKRRFFRTCFLWRNFLFPNSPQMYPGPMFLCLSLLSRRAFPQVRNMGLL